MLTFIFVKTNINDLEKAEELGKQISKYATERLTGLELEFEKIFKSFLPLTKKRYGAWVFKLKKDKWVDEIETKGIETVRRDWCELVSEVVQRMLNIILKENDVHKAVEEFKQTINDIETGKIDINKLVITKTITKNIDTYKGIQPHIELAKRLRKRNPADAPGVGDRIGFVIIKGAELLSKRAEDPFYVIENKIDIDTNYYIENQLLPPLERLLEALGVSKNEILGKGKQSNIFKFNEKKLKKVDIVKPSFLICEKCDKHYTLPTLTGFCMCGGKLLFSDDNANVSEFAIL